MSTDRELDESAARRERGRRLAWIAAGVAILALLMLLGPMPAETRDGKPLQAGMRPLVGQATPAVASHVASLTSEVNWDALEPSADPSPLSVAAYDR